MFEVDNQIATDQNVDDASLENEDVDLFTDEEGEDADYEDDGEDEDDSEIETDDAEAQEDAKVRSIFSKEQQAEVNKIVQTRLERQKASVVTEMTQAAGIEVSYEELPGASRLWGLLKANPELSSAIQQVIDQHLTTGQAKAPTDKAPKYSSKEVELARKEAIVDLKMSDRVFSKNSDKILDWAAKEGFDVTDAKSLKMAYMAWKGAHDQLIKATEKVTDKQRKDQKAAMRKKASMQGSKTTKSGKSAIDYAKASPRDILAAEGLNLFTDD